MAKTNEQILKNAESNAKWGVVSGIASAAASLYSGYMGMKTAKTYGRMQQRAAETQARLNEIATERNIGYQTRQTQDQIADIQRQGKQVLGRQLASMAATVMSTASGSSQALMRSTGFSVGRDISTLQANLMNSAYEQRRATAIENIGLKYQGLMARYSAKAEGFNQLATGFSGALSAATAVSAKWTRWQDLQYANQAKTPVIDANSPALIRSSEEWDSYFGYGSPSLTGIQYDFVDAAGSANLIPNLSLSPTRKTALGTRGGLRSYYFPKMRG